MNEGKCKEVPDLFYILTINNWAKKKNNKTMT